MKSLRVTAAFFLLTFSGCMQKDKKDNIFKNIPIQQTKKYITDIYSKIWEEAGIEFTGRPSPQKDSSYYDERNYRDSLGNLAEYSIIEILSDTAEHFTNYYFYKGHLLFVEVHKISNKRFLGNSRYYFRDGKLFESETEGLPLISADTLINNSKLYLSYKGDKGDKRYR